MKNQIGLQIACFVISVGTVTAQTNPDLYDMPTAENVLKNVKGADNIDTYAKQCAALSVLWDVAMSGIEKKYMFSDPKMDKKIKYVIIDQKEEYNKTMGLVYKKFLEESNFSNDKEGPAKWGALWKEYYYRTPGFKEEIIETLFNERAKNQYYEINKKPVTNTNTTESSTELKNSKPFSLLEEIEKTTVPQTSEEEIRTTAKTTIKFGFDENHELIPNPIIYNVPGVSKANLYNRALIWISKNFINPDDVIVSNIKGELIKIYAVEPMNKWATSLLPYTIQLDFKEGRYRLTYSNLTLRDPQTLLKDKIFTEHLRNQTRNEQAAYNEKGFEFLDSVFKSINNELTGENKTKDDW